MLLAGDLPDIEDHVDGPDPNQLVGVEKIIEDIGLTSFAVHLQVDVVLAGRVFAHPVRCPDESDRIDLTTATLWLVGVDTCPEQSRPIQFRGSRLVGQATTVDDEAWFTKPPQQALAILGRFE
jgi:hypothetical protein